MKGQEADKAILEMCKRNIIVLTLKGKEVYCEFTPEFKGVMRQVGKEYEGHIQKGRLENVGGEKDRARFTVLCLLEHCEKLTEDEMTPMAKVLSTMFQQRSFTIKRGAEND